MFPSAIFTRYLFPANLLTKGHRLKKSEHWSGYGQGTSAGYEITYGHRVSPLGHLYPITGHNGWTVIMMMMMIINLLKVLRRLIVYHCLFSIYTELRAFSQVWWCMAHKWDIWWRFIFISIHLTAVECIL